MTQKEIFYRNRNCGYIELEKKVFVTERKFLEHYFRKFGGYGESVYVLKELLKYDTEDIVFIIDDTPYYVSVTTFFSNGMEYTDQETDKQLILPFNFFKLIENNKMPDTQEVLSQ